MTYLIRTQAEHPYIVYEKNGSYHIYKTLRQMIEADRDLLLFQNDENRDRAIKQKIRAGQVRPLHKEIQQIVTFLRDKKQTLPRDIRYGYDNLVSKGLIDLGKSRRDVKSIYSKRRFQEAEVMTPVLPKKSRASTIQRGQILSRTNTGSTSGTKMRKTGTKKQRTSATATKSTKLVRFSSWDNILDHIPCVVEDPDFLGGHYPLVVRKPDEEITIHLFGNKSKNCLTMIKEKHYLYIKLILFFVDYRKCFPGIQILPLVFFNQCMNLSLRIARAMKIEYIVLDDHSYITPPTTAQQWDRHSKGEMLDDSQYHPMYQKVLNLLDIGMTYYGRYYGFHLLPKTLFNSACEASSGHLSPSTIDFFKDLDMHLSIAIHTLAKRYTLRDLYIHQCEPYYFSSKSHLSTLQHLDQFLGTMPSLSLDTTIQELAHYIRHHIKDTKQIDSVRTLYNLLSLCLFVTPDYFRTFESSYMDLVYRFIGTSTPDWTSMDLRVDTPEDLGLRDLATLMLGTSSFYTFSVRFITQ